MKNVFIISLLLAVLLTGLLPATAQRARPGAAGNTGVRLLPGKILTMSADSRSGTLALYLRAPAKDAPGKVPDEMAQLAAVLSGQADQLQQQGKTEVAARLRRHVDELLCWRELSFPVADWSQISLIGARKVGCDQITVGIRLRAVVGVDGALRPQDIPSRAALARDAEQIGPNLPAAIRRLPDAGARRTFFEIVGEVASVNPLVVRAGEQTMQIDTPPQYRFVQRAPVAPRELKPGYRVLAAVRLGGIRIVEMNNLIVLFDRTDFTLEDVGGAD